MNNMNNYDNDSNNDSNNNTDFIKQSKDKH